MGYINVGLSVVARVLTVLTQNLQATSRLRPISISFNVTVHHTRCWSWSRVSALSDQQLLGPLYLSILLRCHFNKPRIHIASLPPFSAPLRLSLVSNLTYLHGPVSNCPYSYQCNRARALRMVTVVTLIGSILAVNGICRRRFVGNISDQSDRHFRRLSPDNPRHTCSHSRSSSHMPLLSL